MAESEPNPVDAQDLLWEAECARRTLLSHLGITPLVSRFDPIAAKPAQRFDVPTGSVDVSPSSAPATAKSGDEMQAAQLREMLRRDADAGASTEEAGATSRSPAEEADEAAADRSESPADAKRSVTPDTPLSLLLVTSGDVLWVEVLEDQLLRQEQLQLIAAMARAIRGASVRCAHQQFDWPPAAGSAIAASGGMEGMLSGFLHRLTSDHATRHIVRLGICEVLPASDLPVHEIPSSLEMLREGSLKQSAWSVLKPLRAGD
jgi:hypothetical protein